MAKAMIDDSTLTGIANAIRAKTGSTDTMLPSAMAAAISGISTGTGGGGGLDLPDTIVAGDTPVMICTTGKKMTNTSTGADTGLALTMPRAGTYRFYVGTSVSSASGMVELYKNGEKVEYKTAGVDPVTPVSFDVECNAGDVISIWAFRGSGYIATMSVYALIACIDWDNGF